MDFLSNDLDQYITEDKVKKKNRKCEHGRDKYVDSEGNTIKSCWRLNKQGIMTIMKTKEEEWKQRIGKLKETIQYWIDNRSNKTIEVVELFY